VIRGFDVKEKVLGVIPARGGSKGIPRKNLVNLNGKPIISYILTSALKADCLDRVIVSTEDKEIAQVSRKYGAEVPFFRPSELASDDVSIIPVLKHVADYLENTERWNADIVVSLQPTSPLTSPDEIDSAVQKLIETGCDSVVGVCNAVDHPFWTYKLDGDRVLPLISSNQHCLQRQELPEVYVFNGALYVRRRKLLVNWQGEDFALGNDIRAIVMGRSSKDIHEIEDLWVIERILEESR
jgi:N-acylneuraminate cytidylyltransferase/CMP-N,N'-diacetyllegionaminic acid synthase